MIGAEDALLLAASFVAGIINSVAGGGSLITFPALVFCGRDPILANATNSVTLWPGSLAAMLGLRSELAGARPWLVRLGVPSLVGGALGAVLLLRTPSPVFAALVPWLVLFATVVFALQGPILHGLRRGRRPTTDGPHVEWWIGGALFQLAVSIYGGYFGAGMGIMMLAGLGLLGFTDVHQMIGIRNVCAVAINGIAALYFVAGGVVHWPDVLVLTLGQIAGGYSGARLARRLGPTFIRRFVIAVGLAMTASLLLRH